MLPLAYRNIETVDMVTMDEIKTTEKVLKFVSRHKGMANDDFNIIGILKKTTNILRWFMGKQILDLQYYDEDQQILCIYLGKLVIVEIKSAQMSVWNNNIGSFEEIRLATEYDKYPHVNIYGMEEKRNKYREPFTQELERKRLMEINPDYEGGW